MLIERTYTKAQETFEFKMIKPRKFFHFIPSISIEGSWMISLLDLELYNSIFNETEQNNKIQLYKFPDEKAGGVSYEKVRMRLKNLDISDITATDLQNDIKAPIVIEEYKEQVTKRTKDAGCMNFVVGYVSSVF